MGIEVSVAKVVTINDTHENGVDTSVATNPTDGRLKGIPLVHVFSRNQKSARRDDGNPLIYALKARRGFSISAYWEQQLLSRAAQILDKVKPNLVRFDHCMPIPSSSPFCERFADVVSVAAEAPILDPAFLRKAQVGELLAAAEARPPKVRSGLKGSLATQLHAWGKMDPTAIYQAKEVDLGLRHLFQTFVLDADAPDIDGKRILVVDDLFATGSSLLSVREILQNQLGAEVAGVCFLSGV